MLGGAALDRRWWSARRILAGAVRTQGVALRRGTVVRRAFGYDVFMTRTEAVKTLREFLRMTPVPGVRALSLFGSVGRDEAGLNSDIDVLVDFESAPTFLEFMELKCALEDFLGLPVDLVDRAALRENWRSIVEQEAIRVA